MFDKRQAKIMECFAPNEQLSKMRGEETIYKGVVAVSILALTSISVVSAMTALEARKSLNYARARCDRRKITTGIGKDVRQLHETNRYRK